MAGIKRIFLEEVLLCGGLHVRSFQKLDNIYSEFEVKPLKQNNYMVFHGSSVKPVSCSTYLCHMVITGILN